MEPIRSIRQKYKDFSKVNKRIADYILKDPTRLLSLTANEIASNSETSPASVTRFSKQLGFDSWEELKLSIAAVQAASNGKKDIDPIVAADDSVDTICMKVESLLNATIEVPRLVYPLYKINPWNEQSRMLKKRKKFIWLELVPLL